MFGTIDKSKGYYVGHAAKDSRSLMNVTFTLENAALEAKFVEEATAEGFIGIKGHRSVGGLRASIYNAMPIEGVEALIDYMQDFERQHG